MSHSVTTKFGDVLTKENVLDLDGCWSRFSIDDLPTEYVKLTEILQLKLTTIDNIFYYVINTIQNILDNGNDYLFELYANLSNPYKVKTKIEGTKFKKYAYYKINLRVRYLCDDKTCQDELYYVKYEVFVDGKYHAEFFVKLPHPIDWYKNLENAKDVEVEYL